MPMTVLVAHWGRLGAGPRITARMAEALAALPDVDVLASVDRAADSIPDLPSASVRLEHTYTRRSQILTGIPRLVALALRTRRWLRRRGADVYFSPMMSIWGSFAIWLVVPRGVLAAVVVHDPQQHPGDRHPVLELCRRVEIARADVLVAFSEHSAQELAAHVRHKPIVWIPHGTDVDPAVVARAAVRHAPVIGFFGRISEYKGIDLFADVVARVRGAVPSARGRVVGNGDVPEGLVERTADSIEWRVGWVDEDDVEAAVDEFDVVVLPYREASQSGVLPLAASRGVPAVVAPVGGLAEQAEESGNAVVAAAVDPAAIAEAVVEVLERPGRYAELSRGGLAAVRGSTSWPAVARRLVDELRPFLR